MFSNHNDAKVTKHDFLGEAKMKTWIAAILISVSLAGSAWGKSARPQSAADLQTFSVSA